jgi:vacuolar-type H+-ATPase subunit I/STV1
MSKVRLLTITTIGLLICNLVLVVFLILGKPHHPHGEGPKKLVIEKLDFDKDQIQKYEVLIKEHQAKIMDADNKMKKLKHQLFGLLSQNENGLEKDNIKQKIGLQQQEIEEIHFQHFLDIKMLCKGDQVGKFNDLSEDLAKIFAPHKPKK